MCRAVDVVATCVLWSSAAVECCARAPLRAGAAEAGRGGRARLEAEAERLTTLLPPDMQPGWIRVAANYIIYDDDDEDYDYEGELRQMERLCYEARRCGY